MIATFSLDSRFATRLGLPRFANIITTKGDAVSLPAKVVEVSPQAEDMLLIQRIADGDEAAFAQLYDSYAARLFSFVFKILKDQKETEDVVQEGFVQIWKKASSYSEARGSVFSWAALIMRSRAIDRFRARARHHRNVDALTSATEEQGGFSNETEQDLASNEQRKIVSEALQKIPTDQKVAIEMAFFSGLTHLEISEKLREPLGTVKARIRRGLTKLQSLLQRRA